ncbi:MAG: hypothetical protein U0Q22_09330 [Acidimicrobiales bacterium]
MDDVRSQRWLAMSHPATVVGVVLLVVNDRVLKHAFGNWFTGKLSDVCGLFVFVLLLSELASLAMPRRRAGVIGFVAGATFFAATKVSAGVAAWVSGALTATIVPSRIIADRTDLLALAVLVPAWRLWTSYRDRTELTVRLGMLMTCVTVVAAASSSEAAFAVTTVGAGHGRLGAGLYTSEDHGRTWKIDRLTSQPSPTHRVARTSACSQRTKVCFRIADDLAIERRDRPGGEWVEDYVLSDGRAGYVGRVQGIIDGLAAYTSMRAYDIAVLDEKGATTVVVAAGEEGVAVRSADGRWSRRAVGDAVPEPLSGDFRVLVDDLYADWLVVLLAFGLVSWTEDSFRAPTAKRPIGPNRRSKAPARPGVRPLVKGIAAAVAGGVAWLFVPALLPTAAATIVGLSPLVAVALAFAQGYQDGDLSKVLRLSVAMAAGVVFVILQILWIAGVVWGQFTIRVIEFLVIGAVIVGGRRFIEIQMASLAEDDD